MIRGETVEVWAYLDAGRDALNNPVRSWQVEATVRNVLVAPADTSDVVSSVQPDGTKVVLQLHFPKSFIGSLRNKRVRVRGEEFSVVGDPKPYTLANTPGMWSMPVRVQTVEG